MEKIIIGGAVLYHADCMDILPTISKADAVITDPPYGINENHKKIASRGKPFGSRVDNKLIKRSFISPIDYGEFSWDSQPAGKELVDFAVSQGKEAIVWGGNYFDLPPSSKWLVWDKLNSGDFADCELAWTNIKGATRIIRHMWNGMIRDSERESKRFHPTQKPIVVLGWCIRQASNPKSILDPFMGSGTTGVAAIQMGREFIGIEKDRRYFDIACERIQAAQKQPDLFIETTPEQMPIL